MLVETVPIGSHHRLMKSRFPPHRPRVDRRWGKYLCVEDFARSVRADPSTLLRFACFDLIIGCVMNCDRSLHEELHSEVFVLPPLNPPPLSSSRVASDLVHRE